MAIIIVHAVLLKYEYVFVHFEKFDKAYARLLLINLIFMNQKVTVFTEQYDVFCLKVRLVCRGRNTNTKWDKFCVGGGGRGAINLLYSQIIKEYWYKTTHI